MRHVYKFNPDSSGSSPSMTKEGFFNGLASFSVVTLGLDPRVFHPLVKMGG